MVYICISILMQYLFIWLWVHNYMLKKALFPYLYLVAGLEDSWNFLFCKEISWQSAFVTRGNLEGFPFENQYLWLFMLNRVAVRHLIDHVVAVEALWKMIWNGSSANRHVILQLMFSVTRALFARKVGRFVGGYSILDSMLNQSWLWSLLGSNPWVVGLECFLPGVTSFSPVYTYLGVIL